MAGPDNDTASALELVQGAVDGRAGKAGVVHHRGNGNMQNLAPAALIEDLHQREPEKHRAGRKVEG